MFIDEVHILLYSFLLLHIFLLEEDYSSVNQLTSHFRLSCTAPHSLSEVKDDTGLILVIKLHMR